MFLRITQMPQRTFAGKSLKMSLAQNKTVQLWQSFMPKRNEISKSIGTEYYSIDLFPPAYFETFNAATTFIKWAAVEINPESYVPEEMQRLTVPEGDYAIFLHKGTVQEAPKTYRFIFSQWLPPSGFQLDRRPHLAVMGEKYKNNDPDSEEEIWIPVLKK